MVQGVRYDARRSCGVNKKPAREGKALSRTRALIFNGIAALMSSTGAAVLGVLITPFFIWKLGLEGYGIWALANGLVAYAFLSDLGLGSTFIKSLAEYHALDEERRVRQVMTFGALFYIGLALVLVPIVAIAMPSLIGFLKLKPAAHQIASNVFVLVFAYTILSRALGMPGWLLTSLGFLRVSSRIQFVTQLIFYSCSVLFLIRGYGLYGMVAAIYLRLFGSALWTFFSARTHLRKIFISPLSLEPPVLRRLFVLGGWIQLTDFCTALNFESDRIIIGWLVNVSSISYYDVANKLARTLRSAPLSFINAFLPAVSALEAREGRSRFNELYVRASRYFMLATLLLLGFLFAAAHPIIRTWLGPGFDPAASIIGLFCLAYIANNLTIVGATMVRAIGEPKLETFYSILTIVVKIIASIVLGKIMGMYGVVLGTLIGSLVGLVYFVWLFHRTYALPIWAGFGDWFSRMCLAFAASTTVTWLALNTLGNSFFAHRVLGLFTLAIAGLFYVLLSGVLLVLVRFFKDSDASLLGAVLPPRIVRRFVTS